MLWGHVFFSQAIIFICRKHILKYEKKSTIRVIDLIKLNKFIFILVT